MFGVIQFLLCLVGFVGCLADIVLVVFTAKELWPCDIWQILLLVLFVIVLCLCAALFVCLSVVPVTV
jgi:hypothetical protein